VMKRVDVTDEDTLRKYISAITALFRNNERSVLTDQLIPSITAADDDLVRDFGRNEFGVNETFQPRFITLAKDCAGFTAPASLENLTIQGSVGTLDLRPATRLKYLDLTAQMSHLSFDARASELKELALGPKVTLPDFIAPASLERLTIYGSVGTLNLRPATRLKYLNLSARVTLKDFIAPASLENLTIYGKVSTLDLSPATGLKHVYLAKSSHVDTFIAPASLERLTIEGPVGTLNLENTISLKELVLGKDVVLAAEFTPPASLERLTIRGKVGTLNLRRATRLKTVDLSRTSRVNTFIAPASLEDLTITGSVGTLDLSPATGLKTVYLPWCSHVDTFIAPASLERLEIRGGKVGTLNLSPATGLRHLTLSSGTKLGHFRANPSFTQSLTDLTTIDNSESARMTTFSRGEMSEEARDKRVWAEIQKIMPGVEITIPAVTSSGASSVTPPVAPPAGAGAGGGV